MKKIISSTVALFIVLGLTGCVNSAPFKKEYVNRHTLPHLSKVSEIPITIISNNETREVSHSNRGFGQIAVTYKFELGNINQEVATLFAKQYFNTVTASNSNAIPKGLVIKSSVKDVSFEIGGSISMDSSLDIKAFLNGEEILSKNYKANTDTGFRILSFGGTSDTNELLHKQLLSMYEIQFKKDLLTALRER